MPNETPTIQPWAMDALRELIDIAGLLNDEQFISHEEDPRITVIDRLTQLIQSLVIDREPLDPQDDDQRVFFMPEDGVPVEVRSSENPYESERNLDRIDDDEYGNPRLLPY
ncbi:MAG: hypothetical protein ACHWZW_22385 [Spirulina sp.]